MQVLWTAGHGAVLEEVGKAMGWAPSWLIPHFLHCRAIVSSSKLLPSQMQSPGGGRWMSQCWWLLGCQKQMETSTQ